MLFTTEPVYRLGTACSMPQAVVVQFRGLDAVPDPTSTLSAMDTKYVFMANRVRPSLSFFQVREKCFLLQALLHLSLILEKKRNITVHLTALAHAQ